MGTPGSDSGFCGLRGSRSGMPRLHGIAYRADGPIGFDPTVDQLDDTVALCGEVVIVGDDQKGRAPLEIEAPHQFEHLLRRSRVEISGRLVGEHEKWIHRQGASDRDPLLLAA